MQQGEKSMEKMKEEQRSGSGPGHICSLCCQSFPDIIALQVHIIKNHGALPPVSGLDSALNKGGKEGQKDGANDPEQPRTRSPGMEGGPGEPDQDDGKSD